MKLFRFIIIFIIAFAVVFNSCSFGGDDSDEDSPEDNGNENPDPVEIEAEEYVPGEIIISVSSGIPVSELDKNVPGERLYEIASFDDATLYLYKIEADESTDKVLSRLNKLDFVEYAEKNYIYTVQQIPDDPMYADFQYSHKLTNCEGAWDITTGDNTVIVAVIDTGINGKHEELLGKFVSGYSWNTQFGWWSQLWVGADGNGINSDEDGHGTHVAGIIGAIGNNAKGIAGVAWNVKIMPIKPMVNDSFATNLIIEGIVKAVDSGAHIINMSLGSDFSAYSRAFEDAIIYAFENNVIVVVSMGNKFGSYRKNYISFPAAYSGVIAVGSTNGKDIISDFSITGGYISVCVPGENIVSLDAFDDSGYVYKSGTSMSAPYVSGMIALLLSKYPGLSPGQVKSMLEASAVDKGEPGFDPVYGYGRVDAEALLELTPFNNYGSLTVSLSNHSIPVTDEIIPVMITDSTYSEIVTFGLLRKEVSDFELPVGSVEFPLLHQGDYHVTFSFGGKNRDYPVTISPGQEEQLPINFEMFVIETFDITGADMTDTVITLYDDSLNELMKNDDGNPESYSRIYYNLESGNTYYIKVESYNADTTPGYYAIQLSLNGKGESNIVPGQAEGEPDNDSGAAFIIDTDIVYNRYLDAGDADWFVITLP